jgi:L-asparagine transporter-like permease
VKKNRMPLTWFISWGLLLIGNFVPLINHKLYTEPQKWVDIVHVSVLLAAVVLLVISIRKIRRLRKKNND